MLYEKHHLKMLKNWSFLWGLQVYKTSAQTGLCLGESNWDTDNLRAAVKDLNEALQQTSGKCKQERSKDKKEKNCTIYFWSCK